MNSFTVGSIPVQVNIVPGQKNAQCKAPGWAEDDTRLFEQSIDNSGFMLFVVEKPSWDIQLVSSSCLFIFMFPFTFFSSNGPSACGAKLEKGAC